MNLRLDTPVQYIKGVGPHYGSLLEKKGIHTVSDLIEGYPRAYEDRRAARNILSLRPGETVSLQAELVKIHSLSLGKSYRKLHDVIVKDASGKIHCKFFRVPYRGYFDRFVIGQKVRVVGKVILYRGQIEFHHPEILVTTPEEENSDALVPIYSETEGLSSKKYLKMVELVLSQIEIPETLPDWMMEEYRLPKRAKSIQEIHHPSKSAGPEFAEFKSTFHRRIIFEEFFWLEMLLAKKRSGVKREFGPSFKKKLEIADKVISDLPFEMTKAQERVFSEITTDLLKPYPMQRLLQGDVGSGKTIVSLLASTVAIANKFQVAIMVPTEILAGQHLLSAKKWLEPQGIRVELLSGSITEKERREILKGLSTGKIDVCVGTQALIQDDVEFQNLGLVVIDEQHRFGVHQRGNLKNKGTRPHFLVMTATPIPRTLAMTVYGDLDISVIDELPKGRTPIITRVVYEKKRENVMGFLKDQVRAGGQAYIIFPLVEESEKIDLKDAMSGFEDLRNSFPDIQFGLLHGRMKPAEKEEVMNQFRENKIQVLVSTTVIEVGVDVPNANIMLIEHSERFGLSQLHQLRGRVGRGSRKSYCVLMMGNALSEDSKARTQIMAETNDGFKIAEADLQIRGPGEFLGTKQSGLPGFKMANIVRDAQVLAEARTAAFQIIENDPLLETIENGVVQAELLRSFARENLGAG